MGDTLSIVRQCGGEYSSDHYLPKRSNPPQFILLPNPIYESQVQSIPPLFSRACRIIDLPFCDRRHLRLDRGHGL